MTAFSLDPLAILPITGSTQVEFLKSPCTKLPYFLNSVLRTLEYTALPLSSPCLSNPDPLPDLPGGNFITFSALSLGCSDAVISRSILNYVMYYRGIAAAEL